MASITRCISTLSALYSIPQALRRSAQRGARNHTLHFHFHHQIIRTSPPHTTHSTPSVHLFIQPAVTLVVVVVND